MKPTSPASTSIQARQVILRTLTALQGSSTEGTSAELSAKLTMSLILPRQPLHRAHGFSLLSSNAWIQPKPQLLHHGAPKNLSTLVSCTGSFDLWATDLTADLVTTYSQRTESYRGLPVARSYIMTPHSIVCITSSVDGTCRPMLAHIPPARSVSIRRGPLAINLPTHGPLRLFQSQNTQT